MSYLPELRDSLVRAAERRSEPVRPRHWLQVGVRTLAAAASVAVVVVVAAILLVVGRQGSGMPTARRVLSDHQRLFDMLGALRRPQTAPDRAFRELVTPLPRNTAGSDIEPYWSQVRLATITPWGAKVFLVPLRPRGQSAAPHPLALATWVQGIGWDDYSFQGEIAAGEDWGPGATARLPGGKTVSRFFEVVPDGVAKVVFYNLRRLPQPSSASPRFSGHVTAIVHGNVATFEDRLGGAHLVFARWYAADGHLIRRIGDWNTFGRLSRPPLVPQHPAPPRPPRARGARR
jgi:hypothetical protein